MRKLSNCDHMTERGVLIFSLAFDWLISESIIKLLHVHTLKNLFWKFYEGLRYDDIISNGYLVKQLKK